MKISLNSVGLQHAMGDFRNEHNKHLYVWSRGICLDVPGSHGPPREGPAQDSRVSAPRSCTTRRRTRARGPAPAESPSSRFILFLDHREPKPSSQTSQATAPLTDKETDTSERGHTAAPPRSRRTPLPREEGGHAPASVRRPGSTPGSLGRLPRGLQLTVRPRSEWSRAGDPDPSGKRCWARTSPRPRCSEKQGRTREWGEAWRANPSEEPGADTGRGDRARKGRSDLREAFLSRPLRWIFLEWTGDHVVTVPERAPPRTRSPPTVAPQCTTPRLPPQAQPP